MELVHFFGHSRNRPIKQCLDLVKVGSDARGREYMPQVTCLLDVEFTLLYVDG